ncbi:asparagine--tRNA ligase [Buchnera aphidicola (Thelaxes californica)]|uniref:Asparagine--tRNA ligase n=1 Tax=Buchnera aphidicola (Thelaxes californica) TaxID=1315998 RepID=A0A4D6YCK3_9GAMM|nr:asparagine--tRNA ligase [Buchnera aphidicola]QCI26812.1 asparagine--tRNA ligase [Buchnera aphidicola (Thelaxes californica)]
MKISLISDIYKELVPINSNILIKGWVKNKRSSKIGISFLDIQDGSTSQSIQVIANKKLINYKNEILTITTGYSISINGILVLSKGIQQKYEILSNTIKIIGKIKNSNHYPITSKKHTLEHLRNFSHLRPRTNLILAITRIRNILIQSIHSFLYHNNFYWIPTPIITSLDAEGTGEIFHVCVKNKKTIKNCTNNQKNIYEKFFNQDAYLTVSGQLTLESYACSLSRVYNFGPTFRAENSNTSRHLSEFWMLEVEAAFFNMHNILNFAEKLIKYTLKEVLKKNAIELEILSKLLNINISERIVKSINTKIIILTYSKAINILNKHCSFLKKKILFGDDLNSDQERFLVEKYFNYSIIAIIDFPKKLKAFYMRINDDNQTVAAMDILFPYIGEIIGGSQREERLDILDSRIRELGLNKKDYWWYRDLRKYGTVPHSGFGIGFERLLMYITGINNIRDVIPFPRTVNHANF